MLHCVAVFSCFCPFMPSQGVYILAIFVENFIISSFCAFYSSIAAKLELHVNPQPQDISVGVRQYFCNPGSQGVG